MNNFSLSSNKQSETVEYFLKAALYKNLHKQTYQHPVLISFSSPVVAILDGIMTITKRVALIAENIFKGALNILGGLFFSKCKIGLGIRQLIGGTLKNVALLPFSILSAGFNLATITIPMAMNPMQFTITSWHAHDAMEKHRFYIEEWDTAVIAYNNNPNDLIAIKYIAKIYDQGNPISAKNLTEAVKFYHKAADLNDVESQVYLAHHYMNLKKYAESFKYSQFASEQNDRDATTILGIHYASGFGINKDYNKAFNLFEHAAWQGSCEANHFLGTAYAKGSGVQKNYENAVNSYRSAIRLGDKASIPYLVALYLKKPALDIYNENAALNSKCEWKQIQKAHDLLDIQ